MINALVAERQHALTGKTGSQGWQVGPVLPWSYLAGRTELPNWNRTHKTYFYKNNAGDIATGGPKFKAYLETDKS